MVTEFEFDEIVSIEEVGEDECYDITLLEEDVYLDEPNFIADNIVVHNCGMDVHYTRRKKGDEPFNIHPVMEPILGKTYGIMIFQEQTMDILRVVGKIPDMHTEKIRKAISKKKVGDFIKYKEMFIENGQQVLNVNKEYVENLWSQIEAFAGYGFNASHAYAYAYISARLLWLKAYYPLEFYTAILMCEKSADKIKEYKLDAMYHGVEVCPVHINKSKDNFTIRDNKIYFGFSNIKDIGEKPAQAIVENQPYKDFPDFLDRFGTDATVVKALTSLGVFEDKYDRLTLRKFCEWYKNNLGSRKDRQKRFVVAMEKKDQELRQLLLEATTEDDPLLEQMCAFTDEAEHLWEVRFKDIACAQAYKFKGEERTREVLFLKKLKELAARREKSRRNYYENEKNDEENPLMIDQFSPSAVELTPEEEEIFVDELVLDGEKSFPKAESKYYGFQWTHVLEACPDYSGNTIDKFLDEAETTGLVVGMIEIQVMQVRKRTSKKGVEFYSIDIEDANGKQMIINVWQDDYTRFREEWVAGKLLKIQVNPPGGGFNTLTFKSVPRNERKKLGPKEEDVRLIVMTPAKKPKPHDMVLDELTFDPRAVEGLIVEKPPEKLKPNKVLDELVFDPTAIEMI